MIEDAKRESQHIRTAGQTYIEGDVYTQGGDFVAGDKHIQLPPSPRAARERRNQLILLEKVRKFWVEGVLEKSLHNAVLIELGKQSEPELVAHPWTTVVELPDQEPHNLPPEKTITDIFDEADRALLILGEPGSGKTITLLELARSMTILAENDPAHPIPVVLNLSTWGKQRQTFANWVVKELNAKYQIPHRIGRRWLENDELSLLLDGFDEVRAEHREDCIDAINQFRQERGLTAIAVCSRAREYENLKARFNLGGAVRLQTLTVEQIDAYLAEAGSELQALRNALRDDPTLRELAQSPLMLSVMSLAYRATPADELDGEASYTVDERRWRLFEIYIERMFKRKGRRNQPYAPKKTKGWLTWLAQQMIQHNESLFLIEQLQPSWLLTRTVRWVYVLASRTISGLFIGLPAGLLISLVLWLLTYWNSTLRFAERVYRYVDILDSLFPLGKNLFRVYNLTGNLMVGLISGLTLGLAGGISVGLINSLRFEQIDKRNVLTREGHSRWRSTVSSIVVGLIVGMISITILSLLRVGTVSTLALGLSIGLIFAAFLGVRSGRQSFPSDIHTVETLRWSWRRALIGGALGLGGGLSLVSLLLLLVSLLVRLFDLQDLRELDYALMFYARPKTPYLGALLGLIGLMFGGLGTGILETKVKSNQGIQLSMRNAALAGSIFGLLSMLCLIGARIVWDWGTGDLSPSRMVSFFYWIWRIRDLERIFGLAVGLLAAISYGGLDVSQHFILRFILYLQGRIPANYARFLDYTADLIFLRKVGGGYIFIHRLLLEHFASMHPEQ